MKVNKVKTKEIKINIPDAFPGIPEENLVQVIETLAINNINVIQVLAKSLDSTETNNEKLSGIISDGIAAHDALSIKDISEANKLIYDIMDKAKSLGGFYKEAK